MATFNTQTNGQAHVAPSGFQLTMPGKEMVSVLSTSSDNFDERYEMLNEVGRGGFSIVYRCRDKLTNEICAVKVVDLRPLRLRERFNPARIRREVDIIKRLRHENIVNFIDVYETPDQLMMVMEYCPGMELFDVILAQKFLHEDIAKVIFAQVARALYYLHTLNILHRDIKPENILILNSPHPLTGLPVAKLLDFGLSKNAGIDGSAAKTFVGTPCYVAPEVEYTSRGRGGTYGLPADCWSAGAVLYVMLVARFPEFEQDNTGKVVVRMPEALWGNISKEAKDLIRGLMNTNPAARLTMAGALQHPWLGPYRISKQELTDMSVQTYELSRGLQEEEAAFVAAGGVEEEEVIVTTASGAKATAYENTSMVLHTTQNNHATNNAANRASSTPAENNQNNQHAQHQMNGAVGNDALTENFPVGPLLHLQRSIANCFDEAHASYAHMPEVASKVRKGATLCRTQLTESTKMLRTVEQTAARVLEIFPDLELAVEEGEPQLAAELFKMVREWVVELRQTVASTQQANKDSINEIQTIIEESARELANNQKRMGQVTVPVRLLETLCTSLTGSNMTSTCPLLQNRNEVDDSVNLTAEQVLELFMGLFGKQVADNMSNANTMNNNNMGGMPLSSDQNQQSFDSTSTRVRELSPLNSGDSFGSDSSGAERRAATADSAGADSAGADSASADSAGAEFGARKSSGASHRGNSIDIDETVREYDDSHEVESVTNSSVGSPLQEPVPQRTLDSHSATKSMSGESAKGYTVQTPGQQHAESSKMNVEGGAGSPVASPTNPLFIRNPFTASSDVAEQSLPSAPSFDNSMTVDETPPPPPSAEAGAAGAPSTSTTMTNYQSQQQQQQQQQNQQVGLMGPPSSRLSEALSKLHQVDQILEQLSVFWANTEVVLEVLTKKGQHVEQFIGFASRPRLMARFLERLEEYKRFWEGVSYMCNAYITGVQQGSPSNTPSTSPNNNSSVTKKSQQQAKVQAQSKGMYSFLECEEIASNLSGLRSLGSQQSVGSTGSVRSNK